MSVERPVTPNVEPKVAAPVLVNAPPVTVEEACDMNPFWNVCNAVHVLALPTAAPPVARQVPFTAKQPPERLKPFEAVEVAVAPVRLR